MGSENETQTRQTANHGGCGSAPARRPELLRRPIVLVAVFAALVNAMIWRTPVPIYTFDSPSYLIPAKAMRQGKYFSSDDGERAPLFPLFAAVLGGNEFGVFAGNLVVGVMIAVLLFRLFEILTKSSWWAGAIAAVYVLNPSTIWFEKAIITETLSAFFVAAGTLLAIQVCVSRKHFVRYAGLSSLAFSCAALTRPTFTLLPLAGLVAVLVLRKRTGLTRNLAAKAVAAGLIPFTVLVLGWMTLNYVRFGWFTTTTLEGFHLTNRATVLMADAPPPYTNLARVFVRHEKAWILAQGTCCNTVWHAQADLMKATGTNQLQLSRLLAGLAERLLISHPFRYSWIAAKSFANFWLPPIHTPVRDVESFLFHFRDTWSGNRSWPWLWWINGSFYLLLFLAYGLALCGPAIWKTWRETLWAPGMWVVHSVILYTAIISSLAECGGAGRFKVPVEGLYIGVAVMAVRAVVQQLGKRRRGALT